MRESILRFQSEDNIFHRLNRLAHGNSTLTKYNFRYTLPRSTEDADPPNIDFLVTPLSSPPTNVHVLIGRNGVGKSRCIQGLTATVLGFPEEYGIPRGSLEKLGANSDEWSFAGLVHVSFSAFDSFAFPSTANQQNMLGHFVGLSDIALSSFNGVADSLKELLAGQFYSSFENCRKGLKTERLIDALAVLNSDPMFRDVNTGELFEDGENWRTEAKKIFKKLSSGHSIVLLTLVRLVDLVDEKTLVILDEPEAHLHPPLLSAFIRAVSNLLTARNGVAIIATHSPVVLQEVPSSCVYVLSRAGDVSDISPPTLETFGEAVGVLTREVFGLEVTESGFHSLINSEVDAGKSYEEICAHFDNKLGTEARILAKSLVALRSKSSPSKND